MPPKTKISKEDIISAAFEIAKESGVEAVTARAVAKRLNCSIQPVYWVFENIESLRCAVTEEATKEYNAYMLTQIPGLNEYKATGWNYIRFAKERPQLFRLLYMTNRQENTEIAESDIDDNRPYIISVIRKNYGLDEEDANKLYAEMWIFSHGIASMIVTKTVKLNDGEISGMLSNVMTGILKNYKAQDKYKDGKNNDTNNQPYENLR